METLYKDDEEKRKVYREKLLGKSVIEQASSEYWDTSLFLSLEGAVDYINWTTLPIHERAKLRAVIQLRNMADLIERHRKEQEQAKKELFSAKSKN